MSARPLLWAWTVVAFVAVAVRSAEDEDEEVVLVEDVLSAEDRSSFASDDVPHEERIGGGSSSRPSGRGRKKYDERRKVNKVQSEARHKGNKALSKYSEKELRSDDMRSLVLREAEHVAKETLAASENFDSAFVDDDLVIRMAEQLAAVATPFKYHYQAVKATKGSPDLEQVERVQGLVQACETRFKKQITLHRQLLQSTHRLLNGAKDTDSKNLRRVARNRVAAIDKAADGPVPLVRKKLEKMLASKANLKELLDVQKRVRPALQFGLVREELMWFFGLAVAPFVLQIVSRAVLLLAFSVDHTLTMVNLTVCIVPPLFSAFRALNDAGFDFITEQQMLKLGALAVGCCIFLVTLHRSASGVIEELAKARMSPAARRKLAIQKSRQKKTSEQPQAEPSGKAKQKGGKDVAKEEVQEEEEGS